MKKLACAVLAGFIGMSAFAIDIVSTSKFYGNVKSVTKTTYTIAQKFGDYFRTPSAKFVSNYDVTGKVTDSTELTPRDVVVNKVMNTYDAAGNLVEKDAYDVDGVLLWKSITTYTNGNKTDISEYGKDGDLKNKVIFTYSGSNLSEETYYDAEGAIVRKIIFTYNAKGQVEKETEYFGDGSLDEEKVYEWNTNGKIDTVTTTDSDNTVTKEVMRYTNNVLTEVTTYDSTNRTTSRLLVKSDANGNVTKLTTYTVTKKFGQVMNEMTDMVEYTYQY